jgi:phosphate transport system permease protein
MNYPFKSLTVKNISVAEHLFKYIMWFLGVVGIILPMLIIGFLFLHGISVIDWTFLSEAPDGFPLGKGGGILPAIQGSIALVGIGLLLAVPAGIISSVYVVEFCNIQPLIKFLNLFAEIMAAVPSILYGLFGYAFFVVILGLNVSLLAGGLTLGLMMFPLIFVGSEIAFRGVGQHYRHAAMALGVSQTRYIFRILLPASIPGIISISILTGAHAAGSAAPVLFTATIIQSIDEIGLLTPVMTLPTHLYYLVGEAISIDHAFGTALVLVGGLFSVNLIAVRIRNHLRGRHG